MSSDNVVRTKAGIPVNADFENIVTRDGGFTRVYLVIDTDTGRPYTRLSDGTIQPLALGEGTAPQSLATDSSPTFAGATLSGLTASRAVFTNGSKALVSNAITGSGNVVMSASPTLTGTTNAAIVIASGYVQGEAFLSSASTGTTDWEAKYDGGGAPVAMGVWNTGTASGDHAIVALQTQTSRTANLVLGRTSGLVELTDGYGTRGNVRFSIDPLNGNTLVNGTLGVSGTIKAGGYTVATLPSGSGGEIAYVTDQLTAPNAKGAAPTGGGAVLCYQVHNGTGWVGL